MVAALAVAAVTAASGRPAQAAQVLYLNFSDGSEDVVQGPSDNAARNQSMMGSVTPYPAFEWPGITDPAARAALVRDLTRQINEAFLAYDILVTSTRPAAGPYTMVMIGGSPDLFQMEPRVAGVAYMDCDDLLQANVVFAFPAPLNGNLQGLYSTIAQEAGHALGLQHSSDPTDLMYPRVDVAQRTFQDRASTVASPRYCRQETQNSHRLLLELVGPWPGGDKPVEGPVSASGMAALEAGVPVPPGGCALAGAGARRAKPLPWLVLAVFALRACGRRRGRL